MEFHLIWAQDKNGAIGKKGDLPWHIPEDLKNFKKLTLNKSIIMGRKTWDSLKFKPLPKRQNIVLSSTKKIDEARVFNDKNNLLLKLVEENEKQVFVIGGAQIYKEFWELATQLHITVIKDDCDGADTFFPVNFDEIEEEFKLFETQDLTNSAQYQLWKRN